MAGAPFDAPAMRGLRGRDRERQHIQSLVTAVKNGQSAALVVRGEAGIGKSTLLDAAVASVSGMTVLRSGGIESEMELPFAALHQLCRPMLPLLDELPPPQRTALAVVFGLEAGPAPDPFFVGLAVLNLVSDQGARQPVVCIVDDAQWLDRASLHTLAFVGRRLHAESVLLLFATRETDHLTELPDLVLEGLSAADSGALLDSVIRWPVDEGVRERIIAETHGNPLALLELPKEMSPAELSGGFASVDASSSTLTRRIQDSFLRRVLRLPEAAQQFVLVAAAEPVGDPTRVLQAATRLELPAGAAQDAQSAGLLEIGRRVVFRHSLVRSAVYRAASDENRRKVHAALAEISDPEADADQRAWHRAHASSEPDEQVALELEQSAGRAQARGGLAGAAAFLERATYLTPSPERRGVRALDAADANLSAGAFDHASKLLAVAERGPLDELGRVRDDALRAKLAFATSHGVEAARLLLAAANGLSRIHPPTARLVFIEAFSAARFAGQFAPTALSDTATAARAVLPGPDEEPTLADLLLATLTEMFTTGYASAVPFAKRALVAFCGSHLSGAELRMMWLACMLTADTWDDQSALVLDQRYVEVTRESGALAELPLALDARTLLHLFRGEVSAAAILVEESRVVREATGANLAPYGELHLAAWQGRPDVVERIVASSLPEVIARGEGAGVTVTHYARALVLNAAGQFAQAVAAGQEATVFPPDVGGFDWAAVELIEAAAFSGQPEIAYEAMEQLAARTSASETDWARGMEARCRALVGPRAAAEELHREAVDRLGRTTMRAELARAYLLYGEWLRRENRVSDARDPLRTAYAMFAESGINGFAERARRGLLAAGEKMRVPAPVGAKHNLTSQEEQIARLAVEGLTNGEIGGRLFISPRTVEWHLRKVFSKLAVTSRRGLREALSSAAAVVGSAS